MQRADSSLHKRPHRWPIAPRHAALDVRVWIVRPGVVLGRSHVALRSSHCVRMYLMPTSSMREVHIMIRTHAI
jgi:hypothetical protein